MSKLVDTLKSKNLKTELKWIFRYVNNFKLSIFIITLIGVFSSLISVFSTSLSKYLINCVTGAMPADNLKWIIPVMVLSFIVMMVVNSLQSKMSFSVSLKLTYKMKQDIFESAMFADWQQLNKYHSGDLVSRMTSDVSAIVSLIVNVLPSIISLIVRIAAALSVIMYFDFTMGIIVLIASPFVLIATTLLGKKIRKLNLQSQEAHSKSQSFTQESFQNIMVIKSFNLSKIFSQKLRVLQDEHFKVSNEKNNFSITLGIIFSVVYQIISYSTLGWGAYRLYTKAISFGDFTAFLSLVSQVQSPLSAIVSMIPTAINATSSASRILEILELSRENDSDEECSDLGDDTSIRFKNVFFSYEDGSEVLENVNITASSGKVTALIGPSGSGKTTLIRMLLGLVTPVSGEILIGLDRAVSVSTRKFFSYVPQGNTLFSGTIAENLRMTNPTASDEELIESLKIACAWEFVEKLPQKLDFVLSERGIGLSEGQCQRISIARAFLKKSKILLLDEATAALDIETEENILQNISENLNGRTCIVITHRSTVFRLCEKIYKVKNKEVFLSSENPIEN